MTSPMTDAADSPAAASWRPDIGHLLRRVKRLHETHRGTHNAGMFTPPQYVVLLAVSRVPWIDQSTVGELASIDRATVSGVVKRLVAKGLLIEQADPSDGRRKRLAATDEALEMVRNDSARLRSADKRLLDKLDSVEREALISHLSRIVYSRTLDPSTRVVSEIQVPDVFSVAETSRAFGRLIRICNQLHAAIWREQIGAFITPVQFTTLAAALADGPINQNTLTARIDLNKGTVTEIVSRLRRNRLVELTRHPSDRRQQIVTVTPHGKDIFRVTRHAEQAVRAILLEPLHDAFSEDLDELLFKVLRPV